MQGMKPFTRGLWVFGLGLLSGCGTLVPEPELPAREPPPLALDEESARFAEVLARYAQGLLYDFNQEYDAALTNYLQAVELDTSNLNLNLRIAMMLLQQQRKDEAVQIMEALVEREPKSAKAQAWMGLIYAAADRMEDAEAAYERLLAIDPREESAYLDVAAFHLRGNRRDEAREILEIGIDKARNPLNLHRTLAALWMEDAAKTEDKAGATTLRQAAIQQLRKAARIDPDELQTLMHLGNLYVLTGDIKESLKWYAKVEDQVPDDLALRRRIALGYRKAPSPDEALAQLEAETDSGYAAQAFYYLGELHESKDRVDEAIEAFRNSCRETPEDPQRVIRLALLQIQHDRAEAATETLARGLDRVPDHPDLTTMMATTYLHRKEAGLALDWFAKAEPLLDSASAASSAATNEETGHARFYYNYAKAAAQAGRTEEAIRHLSRILDDNVGFLRVFMYDMLQEDEPDTERALSFFEAFAEANREEPAVYYCLGMLNSFREDYEGALEQYRQTLAIAQRHHRNTQLLDADFYFGYAAAHERVGRIEEAEALFRKTLALEPDHANTLNYLAYMWAERGERLDEAMVYVKKALELAPDSGAFLDTLGWVHYQQGDYGSALREIRRAQELVGDDPVISEHLGDVLYKLDRESEALDQWKRAFQLDPENESVAAKLRERGVDPASLPPLEKEESTEPDRNPNAGDDSPDTPSPIEESFRHQPATRRAA